MKNITSSKLIVLVSAFLMVFANRAFFTNVFKVYSTSIANLPFLFSLAVLFGCSIVILLSLVSSRYTIKPVLITVLLISSVTAYFMDTYNIIIDTSMIDNIIRTDVNEVHDLLSVRLALYILLLGIMPSVLVYRTSITHGTFRREIVSRLKLLGATIIIALLTVLVFSKAYASFFREHKPLRYYVNPSYYIYSTSKYLASLQESAPAQPEPIGADARMSPRDHERELVLFVVGEAARADRFSLNGYERETNPLLAKEDLINFTDFWSCGTSTAVSVPCMFSILGESDFSRAKAQSKENLVDLLQHVGVNVLWLDNNSDSKGVADRIPYEDFRSKDSNSVCDAECRDVGMLRRVQSYIDKHQQGDIFIVLHQLGNHGPAYYKRYPKSFERFTPTCRDIELDKCSNEEISNAYDNAILYTDYFLSKVIDLLKKNSNIFESIMVYVSDHGESLGERGIYLHGLPNMLAPDEQRHVPMLMWLSDSFDNRQEHDYEGLKLRRHNRYSQDNLFHTILDMLEIKTSAYNPDLDMIEHKQ